MQLVIRPQAFNLAGQQGTLGCINMTVCTRRHDHRLQNFKPAPFLIRPLQLLKRLPFRLVAG